MLDDTLVDKARVTARGSQEMLKQLCLVYPILVKPMMQHL